jgi:hypothetical protein
MRSIGLPIKALLFRDCSIWQPPQSENPRSPSFLLALDVFDCRPDQAFEFARLRSLRNIQSVKAVIKPSTLETTYRWGMTLQSSPSALNMQT